MGKGNVNNLRTPTSEEAREIGRKGGLASARKRQERKQMRETLDIILKMPIKDGSIEAIAGIESIASTDGRNLTAQDFMLVALMKGAMAGDVKCIEEIRVIMGEMPAPATVSPLESLADQLERFKDEDDGDRDRTD